MAAALEASWPGDLSGIAVAPHGASAALRRIALRTAAHPVPDAASVAAAKHQLALAEGAGPDDLVLVLLGGGASALACLPGEGLALEEKQAVTAALLRSGAAIEEINCVRRHLSRIKGGRLGLAAAPARLVTLAISDVAGDRPEDIGSGPTISDPSTLADARALLFRYGITAPSAGWSESVKRLAGDYRVVASAGTALAAAAAEAKQLGYRPLVLGEVDGEARDIGREHGALALRLAPRTAILSGGELRVTVRGTGRGGPNQEYALAAAMALAGSAVAGLAADSDGIDGASEAAGAWFDGGSLMRTARDPGAALDANDSGGWFASLGDLFVTGATGTNISDLRILLTPP
jgi:hydroxypyruvate reductase